MIMTKRRLIIWIFKNKNMKKNKKNDVLIYLALAIGGAFLIHKFFIKGATSNIIKSPVMPDNKLIDQKIDSKLIENYSTSELKPLLFDQDYQASQYSEYQEDTYQTYYGKNTSNGVIRGVNGKMPLTC